jgi:hypothetical protein
MLPSILNRKCVSRTSRPLNSYASQKKLNALEYPEGGFTRIEKRNIAVLARIRRIPMKQFTILIMVRMLTSGLWGTWWSPRPPTKWALVTDRDGGPEN